MHLRRLFGTDGIRGVAGEYPLDKKTVYAIGRALGDHLPDGPKRVVIGQDTRESSIWIASVLAAGLFDFPAKKENAGAFSPPPLSYLFPPHCLSPSVVISPSPTPPPSNAVQHF